jgi:UDP-glucose 4-epimerase
MKMKKVLITGSQGFIGSYLCSELLKKGYKVIGVDNFSKYGPTSRPHDNHENFMLFNTDVNDMEKNIPFADLIDVEYIIAAAAMIGGISYFHKYAYDLLSNNERILASTFDLAIKIKNTNKNFKKIVVISSSMVFENTTVFPTPENEVTKCPPPLSTYGFQKLSCEYFCKGAYEQYGIPYTIVRPFNCVGIGEDEALGEHEVKSGNIKLMLSHVLPDLINKALKGQNPLCILGTGQQIRCYTNGKDIARGIVLAMQSDKAINEDFNISTPESMTVLELAQLVWSNINPDKKFEYILEPGFEYDVQKRIPDVTKAETVLNFKAKISVEDSVKEVINWMKRKL